MTPKKLEQFPERGNIGRPVGSKYDKYLDGSIWELQEGVDFHSTPQKFVRAIRQHANSRRGIGIKAMITDNRTVIVQSREKHNS